MSEIEQQTEQAAPTAEFDQAFAEFAAADDTAPAPELETAADPPAAEHHRQPGEPDQHAPGPARRDALVAVKDLGSLIRYVQWRVDEKRRELGNAQRAADGCRQALANLEKVALPPEDKHLVMFEEEDYEPVTMS